MLTDHIIGELIDRLQALALAEEPGSLTDAEVAAGLALLDSIVPDLHHVELIVRVNGPASDALANAAASKAEGE